MDSQERLRSYHAELEPAGLEAVDKGSDKIPHVTQAGLEVHYADVGKEVDSRPAGALANLPPELPSHSQHIWAEPEPQRKPSWRRKRCIILALVIIALIVGAITGGILASTGQREDAQESTQPTPTSDPSRANPTSSTPPLSVPTTIASGSPLSVAGCSFDDEFRIIMTYRDDEGAMMFSMQSGQISDEESWGRPQMFLSGSDSSNSASFALSAASGDDAPSRIEVCNAVLGHMQGNLAMVVKEFPHLNIG
jgi:hypothetical protein